MGAGAAAPEADVMDTSLTRKSRVYEGPNLGRQG